MRPGIDSVIRNLQRSVRMSKASDVEGEKILSDENLAGASGYLSQGCNNLALQRRKNKIPQTLGRKNPPGTHSFPRTKSSPEIFWRNIYTQISGLFFLFFTLFVFMCLFPQSLGLYLVLLSIYGPRYTAATIIILKCFLI